MRNYLLDIVKLNSRDFLVNFFNISFLNCSDYDVMLDLLLILVESKQFGENVVEMLYNIIPT